MSDVPRLLVLTDRHRCAEVGRTLLDTLARALDAGAPAVLLREKDLAPPERARLGGEVAALVHGAGAALYVASDLELARALDAHGLHLAADDPHPRISAAPSELAVGRSCHDLDEVRAADAEPLAHLTVSPVDETASKPGYGPPLGIAGTTELAAATRHPVFALGGVTADHVPALVAGGEVHGVAVLGAVMAAPDPGEATDALIDALGGPR